MGGKVVKLGHGRGTRPQAVAPHSGLRNADALIPVDQGDSENDAKNVIGSVAASTLKGSLLDMTDRRAVCIPSGYEFTPT